MMFVEADFSELDFPADTFDAVTAFYSIMHVPRDRHLELFGKVLRWLKPGGLLLVSMSTIGGPDRTENWLGVEMFFSGFDARPTGASLRKPDSSSSSMTSFA